MHHRHLTTQEWTLMALESLMERGELQDWREFAQALSKSERLACDTLRVCEYVQDRPSAALARMLVVSCYPELGAGGPDRRRSEAQLDPLLLIPFPDRK
ncbi:MAG: hypothetical protein A2W31_07420 [Planctomycetes bacterium RBG_16_64_10]|nr:MAG: hypothetical protein A2W31_07420 [Planctomycetes bacterium RBG_16_64_10]